MFVILIKTLKISLVNSTDFSLCVVCTDDGLALLIENEHCILRIDSPFSNVVLLTEKKKVKRDNMLTAETFIKELQLQPHPEGGFYRSTFQSDISVHHEQVSTKDHNRKLYTSIYFLLRSEDISHLHRLKSDEIWYFHAGSPLTVHIIYPNGTYEGVKLGLNVEKGERPQVIVPKGCIFGSSVEEANTFSLVGCMVSPGFDFADFELFTQQQLLSEYPQHTEIIKKLAFEKV